MALFHARPQLHKQSLRFDFLEARSMGILLDDLNYGILTESSKLRVVM